MYEETILNAFVPTVTEVYVTLVTTITVVYKHIINMRLSKWSNNKFMAKPRVTT
ncbi:hypothetical protein Sjap_016585 [Stephania japonica]|uniref:Uncharacterized protein n=1 Tax=Stephania japonica TaxID=461633 RepID=A0AAP0NSJ0_9MAGN